MKLEHSVWSNYFHDLTPEDRILKFLECGFSCSEFSDEDGAIILSRGDNAATQLRKFADSNGFHFPQGHLLLKVDICKADSVDVLKKWLDMFLTLGISAAVLHAGGGSELSNEEAFERRAARLVQLCEHIKDTDMTICLENLYRNNQQNSFLGSDVPQTSHDLMEYIQAVNSDRLGICLDTGHLNYVRYRENVQQTQREFILHAGKYLKALHIADNDGSYDQHMMPYGRGTVDFDEVMKALSDIGYTGLFNLEIPGESRAPLDIRMEKLKYIKKLCNTMCAYYE